MRVLLEQIDTVGLDGLLKRAAALANKQRIFEADVKEDKSKVYRFGTVAVRWSYLSEKWILQDGVAIEGTYETAKEAVQRAKEVSGYEEETEAQIIHTEPIPMEFQGTVPLDVIQAFQPTPVSSPIPSSGGGTFGGGAPASLNVPSAGPPESPAGSSLGDLPLPATGGPAGLDTALPGPSTPTPGPPEGAAPSAADIGA